VTRYETCRNTSTKKRRRKLGRDATYCRKWSNPHLKWGKEKKGKEKKKRNRAQNERTIRTTFKECITKRDRDC